MTEEPLSIRKARDRAFILPLVGLVFLMPPFASIFQLDILVMGIPFTTLYLFTVWTVLIGCAALLSGKLQENAQVEDKSFPKSDSEK